MINDLLNSVHSLYQPPLRDHTASPRTPQAALAALSARALAGADLTALMDEAVALISEMFELDYVDIFELLPDGNALQLRAGPGLQDGSPSCATASIDPGSPAGHAILYGEAVVVDDFSADPRFERFASEHDRGVVSGLSVVIGGRERPFGVLGAFTRYQRGFSQDDVDVFHAFASVLALAMIDRRGEEERERLLTRVEAARQMAMETQWSAMFLTGVSSVLATATDFETTIKLVARLAVPFLADWCVVDLLQGECVRRAAVNHNDPTKIGLARELQQRCVQPSGPENSRPKWVMNVLHTGRSRIVSGVTDSDALEIADDAEHLRVLRGLGLSSVLCVPLASGGRTIGALTLVAATPDRRFGSADLAAAEEFARRVATVIDNARLLEEIAHRDKRLHEITSKLLEAQDEERRRIAYDVHDGLAQVAASAHQHLQVFARHHLPSSPQARETLERALELARRTVKEARRVIADLRPTALEAFGLTTAIRLHVEELCSEGWEIVFEEELGGEPVPPTVGKALFRVAQEALTNVRKHAQTLQVCVTLRRQGQVIRLEVQDWGRGFLPDTATRTGGIGERVGLISMRERITLLNGHFTIESQPNAGTRVVAEIPLPAILEGELSHEETNVTNAAG